MMIHTTFVGTCSNVNILYDRPGRPKSVGTAMVRHFSVAVESRNSLTGDVAQYLVTMSSSVKEAAIVHGMVHHG